MIKSQKGFTLIELMITAAIIVALVGLAYPAYMNSIRESNRAEAKAELNDIAQRLQRCYTANGRYNATAGKCAVYDQLTTAPGHIISRGAELYRINISGVTATQYTLTATAIKSPQLSDTANGCHELTLNHRGVQGPDICW